MGTFSLSLSKWNCLKRFPIWWSIKRTSIRHGNLNTFLAQIEITIYTSPSVHIVSLMESCKTARTSTILFLAITAPAIIVKPSRHRMRMQRRSDLIKCHNLRIIEVVINAARAQIKVAFLAGIPLHVFNSMHCRNIREAS